MNFFEITIFEGATGPVEMTYVNVFVVFVTGVINLVKIAKREPPGTRYRPDNTEFSEELVLLGVVYRSVDNSHGEFHRGMDDC